MVKANILVVDDEKTILANLSLLLGSTYRVFTARSAEEAKKVLQKEEIHVLVTDYRMPGQDGLSFLADEKERHPEVVRVLMTAYGSTDLIVKAINTGAVHRYFSKPYRADQVQKLLDECVSLANVDGSSGEQSAQKPTVLIAHKSKSSRAKIKIQLGTSYRVLECSDGIEALSLYNQHKIEAFVTGAGLEKLDSSTIVAYFRQTRKDPLPVIVWGKGISPSLSQHFRESGADSVIDEESESAGAQLVKYLRACLL